MRNKKLLAGNYYVYVTYDKVSKHYIDMDFASNDEDFIRLYLPSKIAKLPLRDLQIFRIATFNDVTCEIHSSVKKQIKTDCYLFPIHQLSPQGENLKLDEIEKSVNDVKNQIIAENSTVVEETKDKEVNENE